MRQTSARALNVTQFWLAGSALQSKAQCVSNGRRSSGTRTLSEARRVLIVDDNHDSAELLSIVLERQGHEICVSHHPDDAIPLAIEFRPMLAFLDIGLPGMDGYELLGILRSRPELAGCKYVAVTGYDDLASLPGLRGFDAHLVKPVDLSRVVELVLQLEHRGFDLSKPLTA